MQALKISVALMLYQVPNGFVHQSLSYVSWIRFSVDSTETAKFVPCLFNQDTTVEQT